MRPLNEQTARKLAAELSFNDVDRDAATAPIPDVVSFLRDMNVIDCGEAIELTDDFGVEECLQRMRDCLDRDEELQAFLREVELQPAVMKSFKLFCVKT